MADILLPQSRGYNGAGATINATDSNFRFDIVPIYWQGQ